MSISSHARCDNCEKTLFASEHDLEEVDFEEFVLCKGWISLRFDVGDSDGVENLDFCARRCLAVWASLDVGLPGSLRDVG